MALWELDNSSNASPCEIQNIEYWVERKYCLRKDMMGRGHSGIHAIVVPLSGQGHINPMMHFAKTLASMGISITFFLTESWYKIITQAYGGTSVDVFTLEILVSIFCWLPYPIVCLVSLRDGIISTNFISHWITWKPMWRRASTISIINPM